MMERRKKEGMKVGRKERMERKEGRQREGTNWRKEGRKKGRKEGDSFTKRTLLPSMTFSFFLYSLSFFHYTFHHFYLPTFLTSFIQLFAHSFYISSTSLSFIPSFFSSSTPSFLLTAFLPSFFPSLLFLYLIFLSFYNFFLYSCLSFPISSFLSLPLLISSFPFSFFLH